MNTNIPMQGQQVDVVNALSRGHQAGRMARQADIFQQHGAGIAAGDPNAINALAQFDPQQALAAKGQHQQMAARSQQMKALDARERRAIEQHAAQLSAAERAAAAEEVRQGLMRGIGLYKAGDLDGLNGLLASVGEQPLQSIDQFVPVAARYKEVWDTLSRVEEFGKGPKDGYGMRVKLPDGTVLEQGRLPAGQNPAATNTPRDASTLAKEITRSDAAMLEAEQQRAASASDLGSLATQIRTVAPQVGYTGPGGAIYGAVDGAIEGITGREGLPGNSGARGAFKSLTMEAQLNFTEKTKGAITDREMGMFREAVPNLGQTPEANETIARVMEAGAKRVQQRATFMENWARKHGSLEGALEVWGEFMEDNPILERSGNTIAVKPGGDMSGYLDRKPAMAYTPQVIMGLSSAELSQIPVERMTDQQLDAMELRFNQLGQ